MRGGGSLLLHCFYIAAKCSKKNNIFSQKLPVVKEKRDILLSIPNLFFLCFTKVRVKFFHLKNFLVSTSCQIDHDKSYSLDILLIEAKQLRI
jgi:hypothetical protein